MHMAVLAPNALYLQRRMLDAEALFQRSGQRTTHLFNVDPAIADDNVRRQYRLLRAQRPCMQVVYGTDVGMRQHHRAQLVHI